MSEQIQNISEEILEYKNKFFFKIFSDFLRGKKIPFPENVAHLGVNTNIERTSDKEFPAKIRLSLVSADFFARLGCYINFLGSIIKIPPQAEAVLGVPVSKAEVLAMDENNKKIFICDKDGNMIGKSITPTIFITNNVKLIKASIIDK